MNHMGSVLCRYSIVMILDIWNIMDSAAKVRHLRY